MGPRRPRLELVEVMMDGPQNQVVVRNQQYWSGWLWLYFALTAAGLAFAIYERVHL